MSGTAQTSCYRNVTVELPSLECVGEFSIAADVMLSVDALDDIPIAYIDEDVDISSAPALRSLLRGASEGHDGLVISLEGCRYCDGSGIVLLLELQRKFGNRFAIVVSREAQFRRVLDVLGLLRTLDVFESIESAVARVRSAAA